METNTLTQGSLFGLADEDHGTTRLFAKCALCGTPVVVDVEPGGARPHRCRKAGCGGAVRGWKPIQATHRAGTRCGASCRFARGPLCVCSCSGAGHGHGWMTSIDMDEEDA